MVLRKKLISLFFSFFLTINLFCLNVPQLKGRVNDYANIIDRQTESQIEQYLQDLDEQTKIQIVVLTIPSLKGEDISSFGIKVADKWQIGHKGEDSGAILIVAYDERELRIETGYGLEGKLTDVKCGLIIRNVIIPKFKNGNYSQGILDGVKNMGGIASGNVELVSKNVIEETEDSETGEGIFSFILWFIFFIIVISSKGGIFKWLFLSSLFRNSNNSHNSKKNNFSSFNSFGGGSSFSGFSGGGGHFGGGGASGRW